MVLTAHLLAYPVSTLYPHSRGEPALTRKYREIYDEKRGKGDRDRSSTTKEEPEQAVGR